MRQRGRLPSAVFKNWPGIRRLTLEILKAKKRCLDRLCSDEYLDFDDACCGVQKRGQGGKNGYTSWGDYYLMEAVARELKEGPTFW